MADEAHTRGVPAVLCFTASVAVGTPRDGQDTTGRNSIIEAYPVQRADFTKEFANFLVKSARCAR